MEREIKKLTVEEFGEILFRNGDRKLPTLPEKGVLIASDGDNNIKWFSPIGFEANSWEDVVKAVEKIPLRSEELYYSNRSNLNYCNTWYILFSVAEKRFFHSREIEKGEWDSRYKNWDILKPFWELLDSFSKIAIPIRCDFMETVPGRWSPLHSKYRATVLAHIEKSSEYVIHSTPYGMYYIRFDKAEIISDDGETILSKKTNNEILDEIRNPFHSYDKKWKWKGSNQFEELSSLIRKEGETRESLGKLSFFKEVVERIGRVPNFLISWKQGRPKYEDLFRELRKTHRKGQAKRMALSEIKKWREEEETDFVSLYGKREAELKTVSAKIRELEPIVQEIREEEERKVKEQWEKNVAAFLEKYSGVSLKH